MDFRTTPTETILGLLAANGEFALIQTQRDAWIAQIDLLRHSLENLNGEIFFEFNIPRLGRRIDVVLVLGPVLVVLEFKVGERSFDREAIDQVWDYALDLKNFHEASHDVPIVPILLATESSEHLETKLHADEDKVYHPLLVNRGGLHQALCVILSEIHGADIDSTMWAKAPYHPTPTIVEAARSLYAQHSVEAIARFDAGTQNLRVTSRRVEELIDEAQLSKRKIICFVTGVPGAGKTLVGLNVATRRGQPNEPTHAVFLSGNAPLVAVLREALTRDEVARRKGLGEKVKKGRVSESINAFIQNVHHFRDEALFDPAQPIEHVVIFDEAQRAWNLRQTANFMKRKKGRAGFSQSEAEFLISYMNRRQDWALVICLVGGGQEINTGEAGIDAWLDAVNVTFPDWHMYISSNLTDSEYAAGKALESIRSRENTHFDDCLHLSVPRRSFRSENVSAFVKALLDCERGLASETFSKLKTRYPVAITRNISAAKRWLRERARGTERIGIVASSKAQRLKPHAIDIRVDVNPVHWFLNGKDDTRSSFYLEDAATEFQVQGLELDWVCVSWDGDLRFSGTDWSFHDFRGNRWTNISNTENRSYLRNAYRVLLTRARQGMVIFVPRGEPTDPTRSAGYYDSTFNYLTSLGIPVIG